MILLKDTKISKEIILILVFLAILIFHFSITLIEGDDLYYRDIHKVWSFKEYMDVRYFTWSGRLIPDSILYYIFNIPLIIWRILNTLSIMLTAYSLVRIVKKNVEIYEIILGVLLIGYLHINVLYQGIFWITGSINYIWPISLALYAMIPYADRIFRNERDISKRRFVLNLFAIVIFALSCEQVILCSIAATVIFHIVLHIKGEKQNKKLIFMTILIFVLGCAVLFAPGNSIRIVKETANYFPNFNELSLKERTYISIVWLYDGFFNNFKNLILLLSIIVMIIEYKNNKKNLFLKILALMFILFIIFINNGNFMLMNFNDISNYHISQEIRNIFSFNLGFIRAVIPYIYWTIYMTLLIFLLLRNNKNKIFISLCLLAIISTLVFMFFSPTIYVSGPRVFTVAGALFCLIIMHTISENKIIRDLNTIILMSALPILIVFLPGIKSILAR